MKKLTEHYRDFEFTPLIYLEGAAEITAEKTEEGAESWKIPEITYNPEDTPNDAWEPVGKVFNPGNSAKEQDKSPYYRMIKEYADELMPDSADKAEKQRWLEESMTDFRPVYFSARKEFMDAKANQDAEFKEQLGRIRAQTKEDLSDLREIIDRKKESLDKKEEIVGDEQTEGLAEGLSLSNASAIKEKFRSYIQSQNDYYLNEGVQEARLSHLSPVARNRLMRKYGKDAKKFREAMEKRGMARLDYHLRQKGTSPETIQTYQKLIDLEYKRYASLDKNKGFIDIGDFAIMERFSDVSFNLLSSVQKSSKKQDILYMESMYIMNFDVWEKTAETARNMMESDIYSNGTEAAFVTKINEYRKNEGLPAVKTFDEAKEHFGKLYDSRMKMGVTALYELFSEFRQVVYGERLKAIKKIKPDSLQILVFRERDFLLSRRLIPETEHDRLIVEFMSTGRKGREDILKHKRPELFKAIRNIREHYPKYIKKNFKNIAKNPGDLRYQPDLSKRPTGDDKAARLYALITLADEAEGIIMNYSTTEKYKGDDLAEQFKKVRSDKNAPEIGLGFDDPKKVKKLPYTSALARGGFNGRDLGIKALKVLGVITFIANVANSVKTAEGKDIIEKAANAAGQIATNPGVYIGAGVAGAAHMVEMHPRTLDYPFASAHKKLSIRSGVKLSRIKDHVGPSCLSSFLERGDAIDNNSPLSKEWLVMDILNQRQLDKLVDRAKKNPHPKLGPVIENDEIEKLIPREKKQIVMSSLNGGSLNARARFLFYEKFLYGKKPNIQQLRNVCTN